VIPAIEALQLPSAVLSDEERAAADELEKMIEEHVRKRMEFRGIEMEGKETRSNVLAAVNHRLVAAGYNAQWQLQANKHPLNAALTQIVGFKLSLSPNADAYRATTAH
jgi:hypothetical protein